VGATVTDATGAGAGALTVTVAEPLLPSLVAVIVAVPGATPVTTPDGDTVAIAVLLDAHVMARPVSAFPLASSVAAVSVVVCPTTTAAVEGVTFTDATGAAVTVTVAVPLFPSLDAVIVTDPTLSPLTRPVLDTTATDSSLEVQPTSLPCSSAPDASFTLAESCTAPPTATLAVDGETTTDPTGTCLTVTVAEPTTPSTLAKMIAVPGANPLTTPVCDTDATLGAPLDHDAVRPVSSWLFGP
jgi:hypothetical protein